MKPYHKFLLEIKKERVIPCLDKPKKAFFAKTPLLKASITRSVTGAGRAVHKTGSRGREIFNLVLRELRQFWEYQRCR